MENLTSETIAVNLMIFVLATLLGVELIRRVSRLLHTPLMSLTNAISAVSVLAALIVLSRDPVVGRQTLITTLAVTAVALAGSNAIGGFIITERILRMFRKKGKATR